MSFQCLMRSITASLTESGRRIVDLTRIPKSGNGAAETPMTQRGRGEERLREPTLPGFHKLWARSLCNFGIQV